MTVWTKGFVATRNKSPFFVLGLIENSLSRLIGGFGQQRIDNRDNKHIAEPYSRSPSIRLLTSNMGADINFTYQGESREMTVWFNVDGDHKDIAESSISLMLGCSGKSELFMKTALNALRPLGDLYFVANDSWDAPFEKLDIPLMSYTEACRQRLVLPSCLSLKDWVNEFRTGTLAAPTEEEAFGFSLDEALRIIDMSYDDSAKRIKELAGMSEA